MDAMTQLCNWIVRTLDIPLGWLLWVPRDVSLFLFALGTALLLTFARRWLTNQDLLQRCAQDLRQLKRLRREVRQSPDKSRLRQLRGTVALVKSRQLRADFQVLLAVLVPLAAIALWAIERLDYLPPRVDQDLIVRAYYPSSSIDELAHLVPARGFELESPAIQLIRPDGQTPPSGLAAWTIRPTAAANDILLTIRHQSDSAEHHVAIGRKTYLPPQQLHENQRRTKTEVVLERYRPLGLNLKTEVIGLPPWMAGYLVLTLLLVPCLKRLLRVS